MVSSALLVEGADRLCPTLLASRCMYALDGDCIVYHMNGMFDHFSTVVNLCNYDVGIEIVERLNYLAPPDIWLPVYRVVRKNK